MKRYSSSGERKLKKLERFKDLSALLFSFYTIFFRFRIGVNKLSLCDFKSCLSKMGYCF